MKKSLASGLSVVLVGVGMQCAEAGEKRKALTPEMVAKMDKNKDGAVSRSEYMDFGAAYLKKRRQKVNRLKLGAQFAEFDHNHDERIDASDASYKSPEELLDEKLQGTWTCPKTDKGPISFVFMENGQADVIQNGESIRAKVGGKVTYRFVHPKKTPTCLDIVVDQGQGSKYYFKCIISFDSDNRLKMRAATGSEFSKRPRGFPEGGSPDMLVLNRS